VYKLALIISLFVAPLCLAAQTAEDYFHGGAQYYIWGDKAKATNQIYTGLQKFPTDPLLNGLAELLKKEEQKQQQQQNKQDQDKKDQDKKDQENKDQENNRTRPNRTRIHSSRRISSRKSSNKKSRRRRTKTEKNKSSLPNKKRKS